MNDFDSNRKFEITRGLKHKDLILRVIQYFGTLLMVTALLASDGNVFGAEIFIDQDIIIASILAGTGLMFWAYYSRKQIRGNRTP
ncbi:MAG: hypothetical protein FVQ84_19925 [Planctomycetes bacterium]|nr:hypothetical protein [Planctomycetota bacterium]